MPADLVGGVASVTLGDEEARTRGTQKSVLERKGPPTFPIVVEMRDRGAWVAHDTSESVDTLLKSKIPKVQVRNLLWPTVWMISLAGLWSALCTSLSAFCPRLQHGNLCLPSSYTVCASSLQADAVSRTVGRFAAHALRLHF